MNDHISTVIVAPMTTKGRAFPTRISCRFEEKDGKIVLDQLRTVDKSRLVKKMGKISSITQKAVIDALMEMFAV
jgi:mRNA interferase MazF